jgi:hypothetical protein
MPKTFGGALLLLRVGHHRHSGRIRHAYLHPNCIKIPEGSTSYFIKVKYRTCINLHDI